MNLPLWFSNLVFWGAQLALLTLVAGLLPRLFQIRQPRVLLGYWRALLAIGLLLPFVQPWHRAETAGAFALGPDPGSTRTIPALSPAVAHGHFPSLQIIAQTAGVVILAGIATRFVMLALGLLKLRQFQLASRPISSFAESAAVLDEMIAQLSARAEFRLSSDVDSPVTFGFAAPVILLPERFLSMDARFQAAIACHELLHVRRRDWAHHLSEEIVRAAFWFHPAIAWLFARVRLAREQVVDLEVVSLTNARKPYLEALLEFTNSRASIAAVPAPPFLAERQLVERVTLMLKELRMSRTRLIASLTAISCLIALAATCAVWVFPLRAAPRFGQNPPEGGVPGGVSGGVSGNASGDIPTVEQTTIWTDTVKRGPMVMQVRGLGTLVRAEGSGNLVARVTLPEFMVKEVQPGQNLTLSTPKWSVKGHVRGLSKQISNGIATIDIGLEEITLPHGAGAGLQIDATIDIERLDNVLYVGRPVHATANSTISLFKLRKDGTEAERVKVSLGRASVNTIEVLDGLKDGDKVILSDMSAYDNADRIHVK